MNKPSLADHVIRILTAVTVVLLGAVAAVVSYTHALEVALAHGQSGVTAHLTPLTIDGLVLVGGLILLDAARRRSRGPVLAYATLALGIGATLAVNVVYGWAHGPIGAVVAGWPAVALTLSSELLMGLIRRGQEPGGRVVAGRVSSVREHAEEALAIARQAGPAPVATAPAPVEVTAPVVATVDPKLAPKVATAREVFAELLATGALPSVRQVRAKVRVGEPKAKQIRAALATA